VKNKDTYCPLPWMHLATHPHGGVTLCCVSDMTDGGNRARDFSETNKDPESVNGHKFYNLNQHSIDKHMNSDYYKDVRLKMLNNEMPKACMRCYDEEDKGITSKRIEETKNYPEFDKISAMELTAEDGGVDLDLRFIELRLGNICNVRCRTCNPASSSRWLADYKKVYDELEFVNEGYTWLDFKKDFEWPEDPDFYKDLYKSAPNVEVIYINGGEPTLIKAHWKYLRDLIEGDRAKNITLWYNINMTQLPQEAFDLWPNFGKVMVSSSIDCIDHRNKFIRYPTEWEDVVKHLDMLQQEKWIETSVCQTVSAYNFFYLDEFKTFTNNRNLHNHINPVYDPTYLSPNVIHPEIRKEIIQRIEPAFNGDHSYNDIKQMYNTDTWDELGWKQFIRFNDLLDKTRKQSWRETFSEFVDACERHNVYTDVPNETV